MGIKRCIVAAMAMGWASMLAAQPAPPTITPKIIVQALQPGGFDVAAWSPDGRFVFTASGVLREFLVWDVARGVIVDRLRLPADAKSTIEFMQLQQMALQSDGRTLRIDGEVLDVSAEGLRAARAYLVDIYTRRLTITTPRPLTRLPPGVDWMAGMQRWVEALQTIYGTETPMARDAADRVLPALPRSPNGQLALVRAGKSFAVRDANGRSRTMAVTQGLGSIADADLSPDDRRMAIMTMDGDRQTDNASATPIDVIDITDGRVFPQVVLKGDYDQVRWLNANQYVALAQDTDDDPADDAGEGVPAPIAVIDAARGAVVASLPARCFVTVTPGGGLIGVGLANCRTGAGADRSLARLVNGVWTPLPGFRLANGAIVRHLAASPRGDRLAIVTRAADGTLTVATLDARTGAEGLSFTLPTNSVELVLISFSPDGSKLWLALNGTVSEWAIDAPPTADGSPVIRDFPVAALVPSRMANKGPHLLIGGPYEERIQVVELATGKALPAVGFSGATAVGYMRTRPVIWAAGTSDGLRLWNQRTGRVILSISLLPNRRHVVVAGDGRYDTNLGPDSESFRWFMPDEPFRSLAPQTLMRDYYEPQLIRKLMDCTLANNCAQVLHPVPPVAGLNRQLPFVRITDVTPLEPGWASVAVDAAETRAGERSSGVYGIKLLMNNREIARNPDEPDARPRNLAEWRQQNLSPPGNDEGRRFWSFKVQLPTDGRRLEFGAYAFNSDRVKSDTARLVWQPPPTPRRVRRAFVLTIGVDHYAEARLQLNFAVADAGVIGDRLANIPGYEMRRANLVTRRLPDGRVVGVTRQDINTALGILAGFPPGPQQAQLAAAGHDARALDNATPDDIVIISFSGHGHADTAGNFALLPSDASWSALADAPAADTVLSADDLTMWLRAIAAQEIAFIIDACHSGAAVATPQFKPGPMGDPGLGQLAYDKGLRILAATQADDVALESASLRQGLLTAALGEGLTPDGGPADLNRDGRVRLDEWLRYAVARLPSLNEEVRRGGGPMAMRGVRLVMRTPTAAAPRVQEPSLFDFNPTASPVVLRGQP